MTEDDRTAYTDDELASLALAATPFDPFDDRLAPFEGDAPAGNLLPEWYMPAPSSRIGLGRRMGLVALAVGMVVISVGGFCTTYGFPEFVWN